MKSCRAIFWDVYGTLVSSRVGDLEALLARAAELAGAFACVVRQFGLSDALRRSSPSRSAGEVLRDLYLGAIAADHERSRRRGILHPEVRIEQIWLGILKSLHATPEPTLDLARQVSFSFEQTANPRRLYPTVSETLLELHRRGVRLGIISNAQFYTPIQLEQMLHEQSGGTISRLGDVFDGRLLFWSCDLGVAKPDPSGFRLALERIGAAGIAPSQCAYVGNDMLNDVWLAHQHGLRTVLFAGDADSLRWRRDDPRCAELKPDAIVLDHAEILGLP